MTDDQLRTINTIVALLCELVKSTEPLAVIPAPKPEPWRTIPITDAYFNTRAFTCFSYTDHRMGRLRSPLHTVGDVADASDADLLTIYHFGPKTLWHVRAVIEDYRTGAIHD